MDINLLLDMLFANVFSHSVNYSFILLIISFTVQKLFNFDVVLIVYFIFCCCCLERDILKKMSLRLMSKMLLPNVFFWVFYGFISHIYIFNLFLVYFFIWCKEGLHFHFSAHICPVLPTLLLEDCHFSIVYSCLLC